MDNSCSSSNNDIQDGDEDGKDCGGVTGIVCTEEEGVKKEEPVKKGEVCTNSHVGADTGEYFHSQPLFSLSGPPLSASLRLSYRSFARAGTIGTSWRHNYDITLRDDSNGNLVARMGSDERLYTASGGVYTSEIDDYSTLVANGDGTYTLTEKSGLIYRFNDALHCASITDRNGNQNVLTYNDDDLLSTVTDSAGRALTFTYHDNETLATISDPNGNIYTFTQTELLLTSLTLPDGATWTYAYDDDRYLLSKTDPEGFVVTNTYDDDHRIIGSIDPNDRSRSLEYPVDTSGSELSTIFTEKDGNDWIYTYDTAAGVLTSKTDPEGFTTSYTWDANQNLLSTTEPGSVVTSYTYDSQSNVLTVTDALSRETTFTYNGFGQILTATGPRGTIENSYDATGNLLQVKNYDGTVTRFAYNGKGQVTQITDALSRVTTLVYDEIGLLASVTPPTGITQSFTYDANGNLLTDTIDGATTSYTYDSMNRVLTVTDPLSHVTSTTYDGNGNMAMLTDAEGHVTSTTYNYQHQPTRIQDAMGGVTTLAYGTSGCSSCSGGPDKLTSLTDAEGKTTNFTYDATGDLIEETDPLGNLTDYFYDDGRGNLTQRTDANGQTITYSYDKLNRLTQVTLPGNETVAYSYDATTGDLTNVTGPNIGYTFAYDTVGRTTSVTDTRGYHLAYTYNDLGQRTQVMLPDSETLAYGYDTGNRLVTLGSQDDTFTFSYDSKGRRSSLAYPNKVTTTYGFNDADQLTALVTTSVSQATSRILDIFNRSSKAKGQWATAADRITAATTQEILNIAYPSLDNLGNRLERVENGASTTYDYDALYRLLTATDTSTTQAFTYDAVGNRLTGPTATEDYAYNDAHQMILAGTGTNSYDANGNQLTREGWTQQWDAQNRLVGMQSANGNTTLTFTYDPFNRRIEKKCVTTNRRKTTTTTTQYVYDGEDIVLQKETVAYDSGRAFTTKTSFIHGPGIDEPLAMVDGRDTYYYHADGLGSIVAITDEHAKIVQHYSYDSFGMPTISDPDFSQPYTYTGREWDDETELYFYRARYYDPSAGRFIAKDPIGFSGGDVTLYGYVGNDPTNRTDPTGLDWVYSQSTGQLTHIDSHGNTTNVGSGYAGHGQGVNNSVMQNVPNVGPIPQGNYTINPQQNNVTGSGTRLPASMRLTPDPNNQMFGRGGFIIHGDNAAGNQSASEGCPVFNRNIRNQIGNSDDNVFRVVP